MGSGEARDGGQRNQTNLDFHLIVRIGSRRFEAISDLLQVLKTNYI